MLKPDYVHMTMLTPFPGTKIYSDGLESGIIEKDYWKEFAENPNPDFVAPHWGEIFTVEELRDLLVEGYKSFYMRAPYMLRQLKSIKSFGELKKKLAAGLKVFKMKI